MSPARQLAEAAGMTVQQAAKRSGLCKGRFELFCRRGGASPGRADKMARILNCHPMTFLWGLNNYRRSGATAIQSPNEGGGAANAVPQQPSGILRAVD